MEDTSKAPQGAMSEVQRYTHDLARSAAEHAMFKSSEKSFGESTPMEVGITYVDVYLAALNRLNAPATPASGVCS
ncbi:MAG: hypothetical protein FWC42_11050 [Proteobacteria bacterium]|nr:hypothetical protein [Pseudomonadota bacterium]